MRRWKTSEENTAKKIIVAESKRLPVSLIRLHGNEIITYILQNRNLVKSEVVMIGDRKHDMIGAKNNGIDSIGAEYGHGSDGELLRENCTYYIKKIEDILSIVY
ncbi:phosphoglycolate phosphatase-like HAD superfamily hydrolase [Paenibacillus sp. OAE614]